MPKGTYRLSDVTADAPKGAFRLSDIDAEAPRTPYTGDPNRRAVRASDFNVKRADGESFGEKIADAAKFLGGEVVGFGKGALRSALGVGQMAIDAGMVPGQTPSGFDPNYRNPTLTAATNAAASQNLAEDVGGGLETATELTLPVLEGGKAVGALARAGIDKAAPIARQVSSVVDTASKIPVVGRPLKGPVNWMAKALSYALDSSATKKAATEATKAAAEAAAKASVDAERSAPIATTTWGASAPAAAPAVPAAAPAPMTGSLSSPLPPGYSMPVMLPKAAPAAPVGRVVPAQEPTLNQVLQQALAESSAPTPPARVTTAPAPELPPGYTPRTSAPKPKPAKASLPEPVRAAMERAAPANAKPYTRDVTHVTTLEGKAGIVKSGFDVNRSGGIGGDTYGPGIYVSDSSSDVGSFWRNQLETKNESGVVDAATLKGKATLDKALVIDDMRHIGNGRYIPKTPAEIVKQYMPSRVGEFEKSVGGGTSPNRALGDLARKSGYDGMVFERTSGDEVVAFHPKGVSWEDAAPKKVAPTSAPKAERPYFLKSEEQMAIEKAAKTAPKIAPKDLSIDDLPDAWKSKTGQDIFPMTAAQTREIVDAFKQEIKTRGMSPGEALARVSGNTDLPTAIRSQLMRALTKAGKQ